MYRLKPIRLFQIRSTLQGVDINATSKIELIAVEYVDSIKVFILRRLGAEAAIRCVYLFQFRCPSEAPRKRPTFT